MTIEQAARDFFGWFNRHYPAPSTNQDHEWNRLGVALANHQEDTEIKHPPAFSPFKLVMEAYATNQYDEGPSWAEMTVTPEFLQTLERLRRICQDENLESVTIPQGPDRWDLEDVLRIRNDSLRVWRNHFWFEAYPKYGDYSVETRSILIDHLIRVARKISNDDVENPLPNDFVIQNGIVFYDVSDPENLADSYFEETKDKTYD